MCKLGMLAGMAPAPEKSSGRGASLGSAAGWVAAALLIGATAGLIYFTLAQLPRASTRVPWADEWAIIREFAAWQHGAPIWPILWAPYWGHRLVIPRLIFFADMRWASHAPLIWLNLAVQLAHAALLIWLAWRLLRRSSPLYVVFATVAILALMLSSRQMENFAWSMQTMFPLVYVAGSVAFVSLAAGAKGRLFFRIASLVAALAASLTMPNGILVWAVLAGQSIYLKLSRKFVVTLAVASVAVVPLYLTGYDAPRVGMGGVAMIAQPWTGVRLIGLLLGAPFNWLPLQARIGVGLAGAIAAVWLACRILERTAARQCEMSALAAIVAFSLLSAASVAAGRLDPRWLYSADLGIPSRYFTMICLFWTAVSILVLYAWRERSCSRMLLAPVAAIVLCVMFLPPMRLLEEADDWADVFRTADAAGAALLLDAPDEPLLAGLYSASGSRAEAAAFMRARRMGVFGEPRANLVGKRISEVWRGMSAATCTGALEFADPLPASRPRAWRIEGWAAGPDSGHAPEDFLVTTADGEIVGLARGGLRHRYFPGFFSDATAPVFHAGLRRAEWLGYVREPAPKPWTLWGVVSDRVCRVAQIP